MEKGDQIKGDKQEKSLGELSKELRSKLFRIVDIMLKLQSEDMGNVQLQYNGAGLQKLYLSCDHTPLSMIRDKSKSELIDKRRRLVFELATTMSPSASGIEDVLKKDVKTLEDFLSMPEAKDGLRRLDFLFDEEVMDLWFSMDDLNFSKFIDLVKTRELPACLVSNKEIKRLKADFQEQTSSFVRRGLKSLGRNVTLTGSNPSLKLPGRSARSELVSLFVDEQGSLKPNVDLKAAMHALSQQYPNG